MLCCSQVFSLSIYYCNQSIISNLSDLYSFFNTDFSGFHLQDLPCFFRNLLLQPHRHLHREHFRTLLVYDPPSYTLPSPGGTAVGTQKNWMLGSVSPSRASTPNSPKLESWRIGANLEVSSGRIQLRAPLLKIFPLFPIKIVSLSEFVAGCSLSWSEFLELENYLV